MATTGSMRSTPAAEAEIDHETCRAMSSILDRIGDKWTVMVVGTLANGPVRFNAMLRSISGISHRMLTLTLRGLQREGLIVRRAFATIPPRVEYELTPLGRSLIGPLRALFEWARLNQSEVEAARLIFDREQTDADQDES
jgi:DNA-binding HxlR family transcriptional regulator